MITQESLKERKNHLGGSDMNIIMQPNKFKPFEELMANKFGFRNEDYGSLYTETGNLLEDRIRDLVNNNYNRNFLNYDDVKFEKTMGNAPFVGHVDGFCEETNTVLEIKCVTDKKTLKKAYEEYKWQIGCYMFLTGADKAVLAMYHRSDEINDILRHLRDVHGLAPLHTLTEENEDIVKSDLKHFLNNFEMISDDLHVMEISKEDIDFDTMSFKANEFWNFVEKYREYPHMLRSEKLTELKELCYGKR